MVFTSDYFQEKLMTKLVRALPLKNSDLTDGQTDNVEFIGPPLGRGPQIKYYTICLKKGQIIVTERFCRNGMHLCDCY